MIMIEYSNNAANASKIKYTNPAPEKNVTPSFNPANRTNAKPTITLANPSQSIDVVVRNNNGLYGFTSSLSNVPSVIASMHLTGKPTKKAWPNPNASVSVPWNNKNS